MCDNLRITGDSIMNIRSKNYQSEYIEGILGRFRNAEQATWEAQQRADAEQTKRKNTVRFFKELGGNQDPKPRSDLLAKYSLNEEDVEVSGGTTPKSSPSKPKAEHSPSPSRKPKK
jgi:hypothetical protein